VFLVRISGDPRNAKYIVSVCSLDVESVAIAEWPRGITSHFGLPGLDQDCMGLGSPPYIPTIIAKSLRDPAHGTLKWNASLQSKQKWTLGRRRENSVIKSIPHFCQPSTTSDQPPSWHSLNVTIRCPSLPVYYLPVYLHSPSYSTYWTVYSRVILFPFSSHHLGLNWILLFALFSSFV